ncbi:MAG: flagellar hook-associated protein FlgK [Dehalococcoidia bacterium]|nr:MAG: flagellar hook-associated protein FlgK [Dehalococcoidia bacterium]
MGISIGLNSAMRALLAQQQAMDAVAHNIANANTPGYSRQRVVFAQAPSGSSNGVGGGVDVKSIERQHDRFIDIQARTENGTAGDYHARATSLSFVEATLGQSGPGGLRDAMDQFFNSWRDLANAPEQSAVRTGVVAAAEAFSLTANQVVRSLTDLRADADSRISTDIAEVNSLADRVASLNGQILEARAAGNPASDISDERDLALNRLSQLVDVYTVESDSGSMDVFVGGRSLVLNKSAHHLDVVRDPLNNNYGDPVWEADATPVAIRSGEIGGLLHQRDTDIPARIADLDALVARIATDVNAAHAAGYALDGVTTGTVFFTGTTAATINVDTAIVADPSLLAAATAAGSAGDGRNALAIAALQQAPSMSGGTEDYSTFLNGIITSVAVATRSTQGLADSQEMRLNHLDSLRQSISGVNLDEEMVSMVQYQRGYEAAARVIRAIDDMLDSLLRFA